MVVPPPMAAPCTAATSGLSKSSSAAISRACAESPGPGGFLRKSSMSLPAQKESPAPCQSTTRVRSSLAASLKTSARNAYMLNVIAFFFAGRFNCTRRMLPDCSVRISSIVHLPCTPREFLRPSEFGAPALAVLFSELSRAFFCFRHGAARVQAVDFGRAESELLENLLVVFSKRRGALCSHFRDAVHLNGAADGRG